MQFIQPKNLKEALKAREKNKFPLLAGGTDLIAQWRAGVKQPDGIICLCNLDELRSIYNPPIPPLKKGGKGGFKNGVIEIGALCTHSQIYSDKNVLKYFPALAEACRTVGALQIQNRGTVGGNIMNASPAGDTLPALLAYEAKLELVSSYGSRVCEFKDFYTGYRKTLLKDDEILSKIIIPKPLGKEKAKFYKVGTRKAQAISKVCACFRLIPPTSFLKKGGMGGFKIAFGSVAAVPIRCLRTEKLLSENKLEPKIIQDALESIGKEISPINDIRSSDVYRKEIAQNLLKNFLQTL